MSKKLHISLIFSNLVVFKTLSPNHRMIQPLYKIRQNTREYASNSLKISSMNRVNVPRRGSLFPKFFGFGSGGAYP